MPDPILTEVYLKRQQGSHPATPHNSPISHLEVMKACTSFSVSWRVNIQYLLFELCFSDVNMHLRCSIHGKQRMNQILVQKTQVLG